MGRLSWLFQMGPVQSQGPARREAGGRRSESEKETGLSDVGL